MLDLIFVKIEMDVNLNLVCLLIMKWFILLFDNE